MNDKNITRPGRAAQAVMLVGAALLFTAVRSARAQSFSVLYSFGGTGFFPSGSLIGDTAGNLYGTTEFGGAHGYGTVFELPAGGGETELYGFTGGADGSRPYLTTLARDRAGNLYGVTPQGGNLNVSCGSAGCGVVYRLNPSTAQETVLYTFQGGADGSSPNSTLIADAAGNLYGTAVAGGNFNAPCNTVGCGVVFEVNRAGTQTVLYAFTGGADGAEPGPGLLRDSSGNLYGTTGGGGAYGYGVVFKIDPAQNQSVLYSFTGAADGAFPLFIVRDSAGNLYGDAAGGGDSSCSLNLGCGVLFKIDSSANESTLYTFTRGPGGFMPFGALVLDKEDNLYGTTSQGGYFSQTECGQDGCGVVFKVSPTGSETVLHRFKDTDGAGPVGGLLFYNGAWYGTTGGGGSFFEGVAFRLAR